VISICYVIIGLCLFEAMEVALKISFLPNHQRQLLICFAVMAFGIFWPVLLAVYASKNS
jgi:nitrate reductase NapE component